MNTKPTQTAQVLAYILKHGSITPMEALTEYGCMRLAARIKNLRDEGHPIKTDESKGYATYSLATPVPLALL